MFMACKRRRLLQSGDFMDADKAKAKLMAAAEELGREIRVFTNPTTSLVSDEASVASTSQNEEQDDFYEFTPDDYYQITSTKKEEQYMKACKIQEAEAAERRTRITKAIIRVRFPDNYTLEAKFHPSETVQCLIDLLMKVVSRPDLPFYLYTTPPKQRIKNMFMDFYTSGFAPGAIVHFTYDLPKEGDCEVANSGSFLRDDILSLNGLELEEHAYVAQSTTEPTVVKPPPVVSGPRPDKKPTKPKWFKM